MKWTPLTPITMEDWFPTPLQAAAEQTNLKIAGLVQAQNKVDTAAARIRAGEASYGDFDKLTSFPSWQVAIISLLKFELAIRAGLQIFFEEYRLTAETAAAAAGRTIEPRHKIQIAVQTALDQLGTGPLPNWLSDDQQFAEPARLQAMLEGKAGDQSPSVANSLAIEEAAGQLARAQKGNLAPPCRE